MNRQVFINLPVSDLKRSTEFYEALGFIKNDVFSNEQASCMVWSDSIYVMLLTHEFYRGFLQDKTIADTKTTSSVLLALSLKSKEEVQAFADTAKANGGSVYQVDTGISEDAMFGYEVQDPDGHNWEPMWMNPGYQPDQPNQPK